ncbi:uncharacterized protein Dwil_GK21707 [Drosophila willistoni]|uniref:GK21707 n=1 Tax=Drosophila willistoni TaxID=7260 RepID=B4MPI1_DROWI|nr:uncharacterized protein LOC6640392 [Drosophila willistoni]EDW74020.1 uncharacterized protein Dwil_GK21707 [Drosophila willistoni]
MSIVLDLIQKIVLHNAYELTCQAAEQILIKCRQFDKGKMLTCSSLKPQDSSLHIPEVKESSHKAEKTQIKILMKPKPLKFVKRDAPRLNLGPIDPPQCSSMRLCRDSYFS